MVVMARKMQETMDHETRVLLQRRDVRALGLSNGYGNTDVYLSLDRFLVVGEIKREYVRGTVLPAIVAVQFRDALGADKNDGHIALSAGLLRAPQILKTGAKGRPVFLYQIVNARVLLGLVDIVGGQLKRERLYLR